MCYRMPSTFLLFERDTHLYASTPLRLYASTPLRLYASTPLRLYAWASGTMFIWDDARLGRGGTGLGGGWHGLIHFVHRAPTMAWHVRHVQYIER